MCPWTVCLFKDDQDKTSLGSHSLLISRLLMIWLLEVFTETLVTVPHGYCLMGDHHGQLRDIDVTLSSTQICCRTASGVIINIK